MLDTILRALIVLSFTSAIIWITVDTVKSFNSTETNNND
jgi:hypothetical protein